MKIYEETCKMNHSENELSLVNYFMKNGDDFVEDYQGNSDKKEEREKRKYEEFYQWKPPNEWGIEI